MYIYIHTHILVCLEIAPQSLMANNCEEFSMFPI